MKAIGPSAPRAGLRVGVDVTSWCNRRGFGRFVRNVIGRLVELDGERSFVLFIDAASAASARLPARAEHRYLPVGDSSGGVARRVADLLSLSRAASTARLDVMVFPSLHNYFPVRGAPTVVGLHDTIADDLPGLALDGRRAQVMWRAKNALAVRQAARLFTVSRASQLAVSRHLGVGIDQLAVVPEAPDPVFAPRCAAETGEVLRSLGLDPTRPLIVYAAGLSPHKNVETLVRAHARLCAGQSSPPQLVIAGDLSYATYLSSADSVRRCISELGVADTVITPGFLSDVALASLYGAATAAVVPSLAEGFGLPAVEAAACGAPVVLSDIPAHRESLGEAALFFSPRDVDALAGCLGRLVNEPELQRTLGARARAAAQAMSWEISARRLAEVIEQAAAS